MNVPKRRDIGRLQDEVSELFAELWQVPRFSGAQRGFRPQIDCFRVDEPPSLTVIVELPGVDPDALQVVAAEHTLVVAGERPRPRSPRQTYERMEIEYGPFQREIALPDEIDVERAEATYERGLLKIVFPLAARRTGPLQVPIEVGKAT